MGVVVAAALVTPEMETLVVDRGPAVLAEVVVETEQVIEAPGHPVVMEMLPVMAGAVAVAHLVEQIAHAIVSVKLADLVAVAVGVAVLRQEMRATPAMQEARDRQQHITAFQ